MRKLSSVVVAGLLVVAALQVVRPRIPSRPATAEVQAPPAVKQILEAKCYSCHSDQVRLSWFDQIVPAYWLVRHDILTAREHLDFSTLGSKPAAVQKAILYEAVNMIQLGAMPLPAFVKLHPDARVTPEELATIKTYLAPWTPVATQIASPAHDSGPKTTAASSPSANAPHTALNSVPPEFNGLAFDADFETWKLIATTDRGDNNTFRFILGNDIAMRAAQSGNISPWPDGTRFAKIAWQQEPGQDGLFHPGKFVQVEFMDKDAQRYKNTDGWGWGRWRGLDLKPYGKDARFVNECTGCHKPVRGNDYVYTLPITPARAVRDEVVNNRAAALPASLPYQPLDWNPITMYVAPRNHTTATLYGNPSATAALRTGHASHPATGDPVAYPGGAVLALVTWAQREDPHWFGARIPDAPRSVEFVQLAGSANASTYRRFAGNGLKEDHPPAIEAAQRTKFLLTLPPPQLP